MGGFFSELMRRNVFRVAAAYLVIAWLLMLLIASPNRPASSGFPPRYFHELMPSTFGVWLRPSRTAV